MKIKILFFLGLLIVSCNEKASLNSSLINHLPNNTSILLKINDFNGLKSQLLNNDYFSKLKDLEIYTLVSQKIAILENVEINNRSLLGFVNSEDKSNFYLIALKDSLNFIKENVSPQQIKHSNTSYFKIDFENTSLYKLDTGGHTIICSSKTLAAQFLDKSSLIIPSVELKKLYEATSTSKTASLLINSKETQKILSKLLLPKTTLKLGNTLDWLMLDLDMQQHKINFNGIGLANDSLPRSANLFKNTNAITNRIQDYAPADSEAILSYTFNDYSVFNKNRIQYLNSNTSNDSIFNTIEEVGVLIRNNKKSVLLQTYGTDNISEIFNQFKKSTTEFQGNLIIALEKNTTINEGFKPLLTGFNANFYTLIDDAFLFSSDKAELETIITNYKKGTVFSVTPEYKHLKSTLANESSMFYVSKYKNVLNLVENNFTSQIAKDYKKSKLDKYTYSLQIISDDGFFHINGNILKAESTNKPRTVAKVFTAQLDNDLATNPQFINISRSKKKEILVQDIENQLYLVSNEGKVLWEKQLKGKIQGKVSQVDIYKNGRLQLAFTTENQFIILDRNGKEVAPFTIEFKDGGLNELAVFDYEKKKDYRFVVTQGKNVFMYNNKGKIVDGFTYKKASGLVLSAPKHFVIGKKDYLVFTQENGLKILSRTGKERVKGFAKIKTSNNDVKLYKDKFTITDVNGTLHQIDTNGKSTQTKLNIGKDHGFDATSKTLVVMNNNTLNIGGKKVELELGVYSKPTIFYIKDKIYVTVTDIQNQKIYLFDSQAKSIPNFPVYGNSVIDIADIDDDKKLELVAKDLDNSIIVYKIN